MWLSVSPQGLHAYQGKPYLVLNFLEANKKRGIWSGEQLTVMMLL